MKWLVVTLLVVHGAIHAVGFGRASRGGAIAWGVALALLVVAAGLRAVDHGSWWWVAGLGLFVSQVLIFTTWADARYGTILNVLLGLAVLHGALSMGPTSHRAHYDAVVRQHLAALEVPEPVTDGDLAPLPEPAARFLRTAGAVGRPPVTLFEAHWRGRIRSSEDGPWMALDAIQTNHTREPSRHFWMDARLFGVPAQGLHAYADGAATMDVRLLSLFPVARAEGPEMTRAETVTLLNDMAIMAPSALLQPAVQWAPVDERAFRLTYTVGPHTVSAVCRIDDEGHLVDFVSDDRMVLRDDGSLESLRWSTPVRDPQPVAGFTLPTRGEALWHPEEGEPWVYLELELVDLRVDRDVPIR